MPQIPQFEPSEDLHQSFTPQTSPGALAQAGDAAAEGGARVSDAEFAFVNRYAEARRAMDASNTLADASGKLSDIAFKWSKVPDRNAAIAGYTNDTEALKAQVLNGISDPFVRAHVQENLTAEIAGQRVETAKNAFDLEANKRVGDLDANLATFAQSAAATKDPLLRGKIADNGIAAIHGAVAGGWLPPEQGEAKILSYRSQIQQVSAEQMIDRAVQTQNPRDAAAASAAINDQSQFPGLLPEERASLAFRVDRLNDRLENRAIAQQAHADATAERQQHLVQNHNEAVILGGIYGGKTIDGKTLEQLGESGQISSAGLETIHAAMDRTAEGTDDAVTSVQAWHAIDTGAANTNDVYDLVKAGKLSGKTASAMVRAIDAGSEPAAKNAVDVLKRAVSGSSTGLISIGGRGGQTDTAMANALGEFHARIANGEAPNDVLDALIPKYAPQIDKPSWLMQPKMGAVSSSKDLAAVVVATVKAHDSHQIDDATYSSQVDLLNGYRQFYTAKDEMDRARASRMPRKTGGAP